MEDSLDTSMEVLDFTCAEDKELDTSAKDIDNLDDYDIYRLDFETGDEAAESPPRHIYAAGGEILQPGDHVYMWCTLYQHHGIVLSVEETAEPPFVLIAEFTNVGLLQANTIIVSTSTASGATSGGGVNGGFRFVKEKEPSKWHKVKYQANPMECLTWRPGTCSAASSRDPQEILLRVQFLHDCRHLLPNYHLLSSNCETVAVWCVTGKWETLQYQQTMNWSCVTTVGLLLPVNPAVGAVAAGLAFWHSNHIGNKWKGTTDTLNKEFQWYAMGKMPELQYQES
eukprot:scaffold1157_cov122-Cylindrotheca_fusiformis.AAC.14